MVLIVLYLSEYGTPSKNRLIDPRTSKIGIIPIPFANNIKKKNVSKTGAQVITHFSPTFGFAIESLMNLTTASIAFTQPEGTKFPLDRNLLIGMMIETDTITATSHSIKTCFVMEKSIPIIGSIL